MQLGLVLLMMGSMWGEVTGVRYCKDGKAATKVRPCPEDRGWNVETTDLNSNKVVGGEGGSKVEEAAQSLTRE